MLLLAATTDKIQLVTGSAVTVDVHASYMDSSTADPPVVKGSTSGRQNTAISTATTTDIIAAPAASTLRNVKYIQARNKDASSSVDVTVLFDQNATDYELHKVTLKAGEALEFVEGVGWFTLQAPTVQPSGAASTADQTANAADTYLTGSAFNITGRVQAGSFLRWTVMATKTAAGIATPIWQVRLGTAGTTADTSRATLTGLAQTAAADTAMFFVEAIFRAVGASAVIQANYGVVAHRLAATGFINQAIDAAQATSASFDASTAGTLIGVSVNPGASGVWTIKSVAYDAVNLIEEE